QAVIVGEVNVGVRRVWVGFHADADVVVSQGNDGGDGGGRDRRVAAPLVDAAEAVQGAGAAHARAAEGPVFKDAQAQLRPVAGLADEGIVGQVAAVGVEAGIHLEFQGGAG